MEKIQDIRPYEISLWTLQDSFITVLKWGNFDQKGQVQDSILIQDIDGTQELTFTIPMYLSQPDEFGNNKKIENPIWYNTRNGNLIVNLRKIKVIINKEIKEEREVYEFVINKITERHEKEQLYCDVSCEGLAFNELGKIGYKISLSADDYYNDYEKWFNSSKDRYSVEPKQTIQYWNNKFLKPYPQNENEIVPNEWYYQVQLIDERGNIVNKIYEKDYISSWNSNNNVVVPNSTSKLKEKERPIDIEESNIYNITQKIAEIFEVFCKYEYEYDDNFHIIARKIIYYNNFIEENKGHMDITYPYHTSKITREADGTDLVTKMFVRIQDDGSDIPLTIMNADANKSKEDYILNFDYLYELGIISKEQYEEIDKYEKAMHILNKSLNQLNKQIDIISNKILEEDSKQSMAQKEIISANQQLNTAVDHLTNLGDNKETAIVKVSGFNAKPLVLMQDKDAGIHYIQMPFVGIIPTSVKLRVGILKYNYENEPLEDCIEITEYSMEYDEYGNLNRIINLPSKIEEKDDNGNITSTIDVTTIWLECEYLPYTYWITVKDYWEISLAEAEKKEQESSSNLEQLNSDKDNKENEYEQLLDQKKEKIKKFEQMMGPALREGYWQPDDYYDYNNRFYANFSEGPGQNSIIEQAEYNWDSNLLDNEDEVVFKQGNKLRQYLMIDLSNLTSSQIKYIKNYYDDLYFYYYDYKIVNLNKNLGTTNQQYIKNVSNSKHTIHIDGGCKFGFIQKNNQLIPVLIITDSALFTNEQLKFFSNNTDSQYYSGLEMLLQNNKDEEIIDWELINGDDNNNENNNNLNMPIFSYNRYIFGSNDINDLLLLTDEAQKQTSVNLRIKINSLSLNTSSSELMIKLEGKLLKEYEDYYIIKDYDNVYITIKPQVLFKLGNFSPKLELTYSLSNTENAIYLDALSVSKENAYPKVSYEVDLSIYQPNVVRNIYKKLSRIVHINDIDLKFKEIQGYISRIELDLDHPWQDKIEVKNYRTKFEDLFSTIVASTEAMKKNEYRYGVAASGFNSDGTLSNEVISKMSNDNTAVINIIDDRLKEIFNEAGSILSTAGNSLADIQSLSSSNANILSGLYSGIQNGFGNGIDYTVLIGDNRSVSAVRINKDEGIFIGSNKKIILSSTNAIKDNSGNYIGDPNIANSGANVELSPQRLLMGVSNLDNGNAGIVDITSDQILLAVGTTAKQMKDTDIITENTVSGLELSGVQIKKDYIGLATGVGNNRSIVSIEPTGITLGSRADLSINTNNFKLQTDANTNNQIGNTFFAIGSNLAGITKNTTIDDLINTNNNNVNILINQNCTYIKGTIYATAGRFTGDIVASSFQLSGNTAVNDFNQAVSNSSLATQVSNITSITAITPLYYLTNSNNVQKPQNKITNNNDALNVWTMTLPTYQEGYNYYRCTQYEWSDNSVTWSNIYKDSGLTAMYKYATDASIDAANAAMAIDPISAYGLVGYNSFAAGEIINGIPYDYYGYPTWNNKSYGLILGNSATLPMLIGSNSGITIAGDTGTQNGEAVVLNNGGIALHGGTINLTTSSDANTNVISLSDIGINLASTAEINMKSGGSFNVQASMGTLTFKDENNNELTFSVDPDGTVRCKKLYCDELIVDNISTNDGKTIAKTEDSTQSADGEITTSSFSPNTGYLPGNQGRSGSFTTYPVFDGNTMVPEGYSKADVSLYFTTQASGYWSVGTATLFINDIPYSSYTSHNSSDGSYISLKFNNVSITSGTSIRLKITNTVSDQANYIATYSFVPYRSSVKIHN